MSMYAKMMKTTDDRDVDGYMALLHDDYVFVRHQTGTEVSKADWGPAMAEMMASDKLEFFNNRCIYENDEIVVSHQVMGFPDGTKEAVLIVNTIQDGLIVRTETGATLLK